MRRLAKQKLNKANVRTENVLALCSIPFSFDMPHDYLQKTIFFYLKITPQGSGGGGSKGQNNFFLKVCKVQMKLMHPFKSY